MFAIEEDNKIIMTRGDTAKTYVRVRDALGNDYGLLPTDRLVFSVKRRYSDEECILQKNIPVSTQILELDPEDTKPMEMGKTYLYDVQVIRNNGDTYTIIPNDSKKTKAKLKIVGEVG